MNERIQLPTDEHCTGCQACRVACPVGAIKMQENKRGHIYPSINEDKCIKCNKCARVCPELNPIQLFPKQEKAYAIWVSDSAKRLTSTSGGASYILAKSTIEKGGYFCGVTYSNGGAEHSICNSIDQLYRFQGSKYTHSNVKEVYKEIELLLKEAKRVLFTGTPCQVSALRSYLRKEYNNLYCVDIVCHGVPSKQVLRDRISHIESIKGKKVVDIRFRDKQPDQYNTCMKYIFSDGTSHMCSEFEDPYIRSFEKGLTLRNNCYNCIYKRPERTGDLTIADFWGYHPRTLRFLSYRKGTSLLIVNNNKGEELFKMIKRNCTIDTERTFEEAVRSNRNLIQPQPLPTDYEEFWKRYLDGETLEELQKEYYPIIRSNKPSKTTKTRIKSIIKLTLSTLGIYKIR